MPPIRTRIKVDLPQRGYEVLIGNGLLREAGKQLRKLFPAGKSLFVITVPAVQRRWGKTLAQSLAAAGFSARILAMPDGERHKRLSTVEILAEKLTRLNADRNAAIIAFGGGVVGDVAGMLASIFMRGVDLIQIPTTVLAQVDASIGGKTGVNLRTGKNLLGTFLQPRLVIIDPEVLATLTEREFRAGTYESLKCGVIGNPELFRRLESISAQALRRDSNELQFVISESVNLKAKVVSRDEREGGLRRILNFGHTIGHALETESGYKRFLHGEAVAWGMIAAVSIASAVGRLDAKVAKRIQNAVLAFGPLPKVAANSQNIFSLLAMDKKVAHGKIHFVLPTRIGKVEIVNDVPTSVIADAIDGLRMLSS